MASVGVPITWSAITTAGAAGFLMTCNLVLFQRLGEILVFNTVISWSFTMFVLPALLAASGPRGFKWSARRCCKAVGCLGCVAAVATLAVYLAWRANPSSLRNNRGQSLF